MHSIHVDRALAYYMIIATRVFGLAACFGTASLVCPCQQQRICSCAQSRLSFWLPRHSGHAPSLRQDPLALCFCPRTYFSQHNRMEANTDWVHALCDRSWMNQGMASGHGRERVAGLWQHGG